MVVVCCSFSHVGCGWLKFEADGNGTKSSKDKDTKPKNYEIKDSKSFKTPSETLVYLYASMESEQSTNEF